MAAKPAVAAPAPIAVPDDDDAGPPPLQGAVGIEGVREALKAALGEMGKELSIQELLAAFDRNKSGGGVLIDFFEYAPSASSASMLVH